MDDKQRAEWQGRLDEILSGRGLAGTPPYAAANVLLLAFIREELGEIKRILKGDVTDTKPIEQAPAVAVEPERRKPGRPAKARA